MTTKVAIIGANGKIGRLVIAKLAKLAEVTPVAFVRNEEHTQQFKDSGVESVVSNVTDSVPNITKALTGFDAVIFTAGAGGKAGLDATLTVDLDGAVRVIEACEAAKVNRFIIISALKAGDRSFWEQSAYLRNYYTCKMLADKVLLQTNLDYTILQPGHMLDEAGTGKFMELKAAAEISPEAAFKSTIQREDVVSAIVESLLNKKTIKKTITLLNGEVSLAEVFNTL